MPKPCGPKKPPAKPVHWNVRSIQRPAGGMDVQCGCGRTLDWEHAQHRFSNVEADVTCLPCRSYIVMQGKGHRLQGGYK